MPEVEVVPGEYAMSIDPPRKSKGSWCRRPFNASDIGRQVEIELTGSSRRSSGQLVETLGAIAVYENSALQWFDASIYRWRFIDNEPKAASSHVPWTRRMFSARDVGRWVEVTLESGRSITGRVVLHRAQFKVEETSETRWIQSEIYRWRPSNGHTSNTQLDENTDATSTTKETTDMQFTPNAVQVKGGWLAQVHYQDLGEAAVIVWQADAPLTEAALTDEETKLPSAQREATIHALAVRDAKAKIAETAAGLFA